MACGTPVLAFNKGSMPELIQNGVNGFISESIDEMCEQIKDVKKISRKSAARL